MITITIVITTAIVVTVALGLIFAMRSCTAAETVVKALTWSTIFYVGLNFGILMAIVAG